MGGKSYFCDYCQCYLKNDIKVRKVHNAGLSHTVAKISYLRRYADPQQLLAEETPKVPCSRYHFKGYCKFELFCQFTHYTPKQLEQLRKIVNRLLEKNRKKLQHTKTAGSDWRHILPWNVSSSADKSNRKRKLKLPQHLPPSLKPMQFNKLTEDCLTAEWG